MIQLQVLNKILATKDASIITMNNLDSTFFSDYRKEFNFIQEHIKQYGQVPDYETFLNTFDNFTVINVGEVDSYLLSELFKDKNTRTLATTFNKIRELITEGRVEEAMSVYTTSSEQLSSSVSLQTVDILRDTSRYDAYINRTRDFGKFYVKTGFKELDQIIGGWDREEELATIAARTNVGKSWCLLLMAKAAVEQGLRVGLYSGEMSERKVGYRLDTLISNISNGSLVHGNQNIQNDYKKYMDQLPTMFKGCFKVLTPAMINGPAGVSALQAFIEKDQLDILFIDQHSLLEDDRKARNPFERASNISKDLKNLQVMKRIPIIAVSQQNRNSTDAGIDTTHIAQSDRIAQDSTVIIFFEKKDDVLKMTLVKSRDSENGKELTYKVDFNTGMFTFIPSGDTIMSDDDDEDYSHRYDVDISEGSEVF